MKNEEKIMDIVILILMFLAIGIGIAAFKWIPTWCLFVAYLFAFIAIKIDMLERHPFVINKYDLNKPNSKWEQTLVYSYSIKWLKYVYFYERVIKKNYPIIYSFGKFENYPKEDREQMINEYFDKQKI